MRRGAASLALAAAAAAAACGDLLGAGDYTMAPPADAGDDAPLADAAPKEAEGGEDAAADADADAGASGDADADAAPAPNRVVFVTQGVFAANEGRLYYDTECEAEATLAGYNGTFVAYMSIAGQNAIDRLPAGVPWYLPAAGGAASTTRVFPNRQWIASSLSPEVPIKRAANGVDVAVTFLVWTGTTNTGTLESNCGNWSSDTTTGTSGRANASTALWSTATNGEPCTNLGRVYCFQQ